MDHPAEYIRRTDRTTGVTHCSRGNGRITFARAPMKRKPRTNSPPFAINFTNERRMDAPFPHFARELRIRKKIAKRRTMGSRKRKIRGGDQRAQKQQFYERKETLQISLHFYGSRPRKRATVKYLFDSIPLPSRNYQTKRGSESFLCRAKGNQGRKRGKSVLTSEARRCTVSRVKTPDRR